MEFYNTSILAIFVNKSHSVYDYTIICISISFTHYQYTIIICLNHIYYALLITHIHNPYLILKKSKTYGVFVHTGNHQKCIHNLMNN